MSKEYPDNKSQLKPLFNVNTNHSANTGDEALELAKTSDNLGVDLISIQDHPI
jgi:hypothetical protein